MTKDDVHNISVSYARIIIARDILSSLCGELGTGLNQAEVEDIRAAKRIIDRTANGVSERIYNNDVGCKKQTRATLCEICGHTSYKKIHPR